MQEFSFVSPRLFSYFHAHANAGETMQPHGILEAALYVSDLERADAFYTRVLGLQHVVKDSARHVFYYCGASVFLVFNAEATRSATASVPTHGAAGPGHIAFQIHADEISSWRDHLKACAVEIEQELAWPEGGYSIYFRDPDGNSLELATREVWPGLQPGNVMSSPNNATRTSRNQQAKRFLAKLFF
jgi:catechol 2,3-dioxygenase-like lactoylglutathione lyase family enzyme